MCFGCSKEPSQCDGSFEYPQHMCRLRNKRKILNHILLSGGVMIDLTTVAKLARSLRLREVNLPFRDKMVFEFFILCLFYTGNIYSSFSLDSK